MRHARVSAEPTSVRLRRLSRRVGGTRGPSLLLMAAASTLVVLAYWPGRITPDTISLLRSAATGTFSDWHAPLLAALWHIPYRLGVGPQYVLVATVLLFVASTYFLLRPWMPRLLAAFIAALFSVSPQILGYLGVHMRDTWFTVCLLAAFGFAVRGIRPGISDRRRVLLAAAVVISAWMASASRQNGLFTAAVALIPAVMVVWPVLVRRLGPRLPSRRRRAAAAAAWLALLAMTLTSQRVLMSELDVERDHPEQATMINDLASLSRRLDRVLLSPSVFPAQDLSLLEQNSTNYNINDLLFRRPRLIRIPLNEAAYRDLRRDWLEAVREHPVEYLAERWKLWTRQVSISGNALAAQDPNRNPTRYELANRDLNLFAYHYLRTFMTENVNGGPVHRVWVYLLITAVTMGWLLRRRTTLDWAMVLMGAASFLYTASMFVGATSLQYRYSLPCVATGMVLGVVLVADLVRSAAAATTSSHRTGVRRHVGSFAAEAAGRRPAPLPLSNTRAVSGDRRIHGESEGAGSSIETADVKWQRAPSAS